MNTAEVISRELDNQYKIWRSNHHEKLVKLSQVFIKQYGHAEVYCHAHCDKTDFSINQFTCTLQDEKFLIRWISEEGFKIRLSSNSHGARLIVWHL